MATRQQICRVRILRMSQVLADALSARFVLMLWLARLADIRHAVLRGLARLAKGEFGEFYANLASLTSLTRLFVVILKIDIRPAFKMIMLQY